MKRLFLITVLSALLTQGAYSLAVAQTATPSAAPDRTGSGGACGHPLDVSDKLPVSKVQDFQSNPQGLLKNNPVGGMQLSGEVKSLTVTDPAAAVDVLLNVARDANSVQAAAIGSGLGLAVKAILAVDKACGDEIARKIASTSLTDLLTGYNMAMTDSLMLMGGGTASAGGGFGGVVNGTSGTAAGATTSARASTSRANTADTFSFSGSTITCSTSVSPRRRC